MYFTCHCIQQNMVALSVFNSTIIDIGGVHFTTVVGFALYIESLVIADGQPDVPAPFKELYIYILQKED